nr:uncharacterized protein LOC102121564 [Macaca fascicularis]
MREEESGSEVGGFLPSSCEKFLERRSQRDAGVWGAQGSKRLKKSEKPQAHRHTSNLRATAQTEPKSTETLMPGKKHRDRGSRSSLCHCLVPEIPQHGERAGGSHEKRRAPTGRLRGGKKAETHPLEPPPRTGPLEWAQYVRTQRGSRSIGLGASFTNFFQVFPPLGLCGLFPALLHFGGLTLTLRVWGNRSNPESEGRPGRRCSVASSRFPFKESPREGPVWPSKGSVRPHKGAALLAAPDAVAGDAGRPGRGGVGRLGRLGG